MTPRRKTFGIWPRKGLLGTRAGRRLTLGVAVLLLGSFAVAATIVVLTVALSSSRGVVDQAFFHAVVAGVLGGAGAVIVGLLLLPLIGRVAGVAHDFRLLELSNPGYPLLRDLMTTAPGTYSHSIMTGSLAERAAAEIGANPLLARVGAYYHDIGKMARPVFFVENQAGGRNPHDIASPNQSAFIITAHVREGVALAQRSRLPDDVTDIIRQHHGTSLVTCFWEKARQGDGAVLEADFRYDGDRPTTREAALVMLADITEAAARAVPDPTEDRLRAMVNRCFDTKVSDGQLIDSRMSDDDLETAAEVYTTMLMGVYHPRVAYPGDPEPGGLTNAGPRQQPSRS